MIDGSETKDALQRTSDALAVVEAQRNAALTQVVQAQVALAAAHREISALTQKIAALQQHSDVVAETAKPFAKAA